MNSPQIFGTQVILSFVTYGLMARWYVSPRSRHGVDKPDDCIYKYMRGQMMPTAKTKPTIDTIAGECIAVRMRMLNRDVTNLYDDALRPLGLKVSQMNILVAAAHMGTARPAEVCERLHLDVSTLSRNVERMKARGWLEVVPDEDGRAQPFRLTAGGNKLLERATPAWNKAQARAKTLLGEEIVELLGRAVKRIHRTNAS